MLEGGFRKLQGKTGEAPAHTSEWSHGGDWRTLRRVRGAWDSDESRVDK
jgi:hypothetical protein